MKMHLCKITGYETDQFSHFKDHLKSNAYNLAYDKRLLEVKALKRDELRKLHKDEGLTKYSRLKKDELITKYMEHMKHVKIKKTTEKKVKETVKESKKSSDKKSEEDANESKEKNSEEEETDGEESEDIIDDEEDDEDEESEDEPKTDLDTLKEKRDKLKKELEEIEKIIKELQYSKLNIINDIDNKNLNKQFTIVETFVGCGGAHLGFKQNGFESLLVNDIDKDMIDTLLKNKCITENIAHICPIEKLTNERILNQINDKNIDVLFGGIVCKGFSLAGVRNPFDQRNYLYKEQLRIVELLKPKISIIENVIGFKNMTLYMKNNETIETFNNYSKLSDLNKKLNGEKSAYRKQNKDYTELTNKININKKNMNEQLEKINKFKYNIFEDIKKLYEKLGYKVYHKVLNAVNYNGYTHRKRLIIVAVRNDIKKEYIFPEEQETYTLLNALDKIDYENLNNPEKDVDNQPMKHCKKTVDRFKLIPEGKNIAEVMDSIPIELKISKFFSRGNTQRLDRNKSVPTLVPGHSNFPIHPWEHRSITVREAATITGFPLYYKFIGSHSARCMQIGNAVPVYLSDAIAKSVIKILE